MNREDYQQVKQIFQSALDIAPGERTAYLNEKCSGNPRFRREVEKLFDSYKSDYLEQPAVGKFAETIVSSNLAVGQEIGHYKIREKIGAGGMGEVYLADDPDLARQVAIKILPREFTGDAERVRRFIREAKFVSALNHPNIVTIHEIGQSDGQQFIAAEYIRGETLREHLKRERLSLPAVLEISIQIASALEAAHGAGIIHRDIKPDNIMIRPDSLVKVLDFGVAKLTEQTRETSDAQTTATGGTTPGMIIGTANYMSPEQARGDEIDERSDIFNFGIVLYEMVSGKRAFEGANTMDVIGAILHKEPLPLDQILPDLPQAVERIVNKALTKDRTERYQTAKDLLTDLKTAKQDLQFKDKLRTSDVANRSTSISTGVKKHKRSFAAALAVLLFAAIGFGYWFVAIRSANAKQIDSIAIMPFVNDSGNPDAEYLSDGMTETLISSLSRVSGLNVKAREAVFRYKGKGKDAQTIGKELNVQAILNGRFSQRGDQITLTVELMDPQTENVMWSEQYSRKQIDLITLQSEIARSVSAKLRSGLSASEVAKITKRPSDDLEAYKYYLLGQFYLNKLDPESLKKAVVQYNAAIEKDPNYALAYVGLAGAYASMPHIMTAGTSETSRQAREYVNRALQIDDSLAAAHTALARIEMGEWNWEAAEREYKRSIELDLNYPSAHMGYSRYLRYTGRLNEGLAEIKRASDLDPMNSGILINLSAAYTQHGDLDLAIEQALKIIELEPDKSEGHGMLGYAYIGHGRIDKAITEAQVVVEMEQRRSYSISVLGEYHAEAGNLTEAQAIVKELEERSAKGEENDFFIASVYARLGDTDKAFYWLEAAFRNRSYAMGALWLARWPDSFRQDPRFNDLLRRIGLPEIPR